MARPLRINISGMMYHVMSRGNERKRIFFDDEDKEKFIHYLDRMQDRFRIQIYSFVLMDNHYHLELRTEEANLSSALHWLNTSYSVYFNRKWKRTGHLFQGRFKSILIESLAYMLRVSYYIHLNPLHAGMIERLHEYEWSSYKNYTRIKDKYSFIHSDNILRELAEDPEKARRKYYRMIYAQVDYGESILSEVKHGFILGCEAFVSRIMNIVKKKREEDIPQLKKLRNEEILELILSTITEMSGQTRQTFTKNPGRTKNPARMAAIYLLAENTSLSYREIGFIFHMSGSAVRKNIQRMSDDPVTYSQAHSIVKSFHCPTVKT